MEDLQKKSLISGALPSEGKPISDAALTRMVEIAEEAFFPKLSIILSAEQPQEYLYLITSGIARSYSLDLDGQDATKLFVSEGEFLIGESLFSDTSYEAFEALEDLSCLRFEAAALREIILSDEGLTRAYVGLLEETLRYKMRREYQFQSTTAAERYQEFRRQFPQLEERVPQRSVASYIGVTKESLSRLKKKA